MSLTCAIIFALQLSISVEGFITERSHQSNLLSWVDTVAAKLNFRAGRTTKGVFLSVFLDVVLDTGGQAILNVGYLRQPMVIFSCQTLPPKEYVVSFQEVVVSCSSKKNIEDQLQNIHLHHPMTSAILFHLQVFPVEYIFIDTFIDFLAEHDTAAFYDIDGDNYDIRLRVPGIASILHWSAFKDKMTDVFESPCCVNGKEFSIAVNPNAPWTVIEDADLSDVPRVTYNGFKRKTVEQTEVLKAVGIDMEIVSVLAEVMNFSYRLFLSSDGQWGAPGPKNSIVFTGMIGDVQAGLVDMAITSITVTSIRAQVTKFSTPYYKDVLIFVTKSSSSRTALSTVFFKYTRVWILIFLSLVICSFVLWLTSKLGDAEKDLSFSSWFIVCIEIFTGQSLSHIHAGTAGRFVLYGLMPASVVISAVYGGTLISLFSSTTVQDSSLDTLEDLATAVAGDHFRVTTKPATSMYTLLETASPNSLYGQLFRGFIDCGCTDNDGGLLAVLENPKLAYISTMVGLEVTMNTMGLSQFHKSTEQFNPNDYALVFPMHSYYIEAFNNRILQLQFSGLIEKWSQEWKSKYSKKEESLECSIFCSVESLSLESMQGAFYLLLLGNAFAVLGFLAEVIFLKCKKISQLIK